MVGPVVVGVELEGPEVVGCLLGFIEGNLDGSALGYFEGPLVLGDEVRKGDGREGICVGDPVILNVGALVVGLELGLAEGVVEPGD